MSFSAAKRHQTKIGSHHRVEEDIYSLNKHALGPGELAESEWLKAGLASPDTVSYTHLTLPTNREV